MFLFCFPYIHSNNKNSIKKYLNNLKNSKILFSEIHIIKIQKVRSRFKKSSAYHYRKRIKFHFFPFTPYIYLTQQSVSKQQKVFLQEEFVLRSECETI